MFPLTFLFLPWSFLRQLLLNDNEEFIHPSLLALHLFLILCFCTEPVIVTSGIILRCFFIVAYAYFIATTYISQRDITFISLDPTSGICVSVPIAITNTYTVDVHGNWDGSLSYNPTQGMYSVTMNNFLHNNAGNHHSTTHHHHIYIPFLPMYYVLLL